MCGRPERTQKASFARVGNSMQSVLSVRFFSRSRTASAAPAGCGRVQRKRSDVKRVTQSREHSALSKIFLQSTVRRAWLDEST